MAKAKQTQTGEKAFGSNKVDAQGRVAIPAAARAEFTIEIGAQLLFVKSKDGELLIRKL